MSGLKSHHFRLNAQLSFTVFTRHASMKGSTIMLMTSNGNTNLAQSSLRKSGSISVALIAMSVGPVALITIWPQSDLTCTHLVIICCSGSRFGGFLGVCVWTNCKAKS